MIYDMVGGPIDGARYDIRDDESVCFVNQPVSMPTAMLNADPAKPEVEFAVVEHAYARDPVLPWRFVYAGVRQRQ